MFFFYIPLLLQILLIVHAFKTGRDRIWIYVLIFLPLAGAVAYLIIEILPEFSGSSTANKAKKAISQAAAPNREFEKLQSMAELSPTFDNLKKLGEEYFKRKQYTEAAELFNRALSGPFNDDAGVLYKLAETYYFSSRYEEAKSALYRIYNKQNDNSNIDVIFLLAETEYQTGNLEKAEEYYQKAANRGADFRYRYNYGKFLLNKGNKKEANEQFLQILNAYEILPPHYKKKNRKWVTVINEEMKNI